MVLLEESLAGLWLSEREIHVYSILEGLEVRKFANEVGSGFCSFEFRHVISSDHEDFN